MGSKQLSEWEIVSLLSYHTFCWIEFQVRTWYYSSDLNQLSSKDNHADHVPFHPLYTLILSQGCSRLKCNSKFIRHPLPSLLGIHLGDLQQPMRPLILYRWNSYAFRLWYALQCRPPHIDSANPAALGPPSWHTALPTILMGPGFLTQYLCWTLLWDYQLCRSATLIDANGPLLQGLRLIHIGVLKGGEGLGWGWGCGWRWGCFPLQSLILSPFDRWAQQRRGLRLIAIGIRPATLVLLQGVNRNKEVNLPSLELWIRRQDNSLLNQSLATGQPQNMLGIGLHNFPRPDCPAILLHTPICMQYSHNIKSPTWKHAGNAALNGVSHFLGYPNELSHWFLCYLLDHPKFILLLYNVKRSCLKSWPRQALKAVCLRIKDQTRATNSHMGGGGGTSVYGRRLQAHFPTTFCTLDCYQANAL